MSKIKFLPSQKVVEAKAGMKILAVAVRHKLPIRYGCAAAQCGTCPAIIVAEEGAELSPPESDELQLLERLDLKIEDGFRLTCRAKIVSGNFVVDLDSQV